MLAIAVDDDEQLTWNLKALEMATHSADERAFNWQGSLLNNIGWTYFAQSDYPKALHHFERCRDFYANAPTKQHEWLIARYSIAKTWRMQARYAEAFDEQMQILAIRHQNGDAGAYVEEELGELLLAQGKAIGRRQTASCLI